MTAVPHGRFQHEMAGNGGFDAGAPNPDGWQVGYFHPAIEGGPYWLHDCWTALPIRRLDDGQAFVVDPQGWRYRVTAPGDATVADLVQIGDVVATNYETGPYIVEEVYEYAIYGLPAFSLSLTPVGATKRQRGSCGINEIVACGGRLLMLFMANADEVLVTARGGAERQLPLF